jgi:hypothetical protein
LSFSRRGDGYDGQGVADPIIEGLNEIIGELSTSDYRR